MIIGFRQKGLRRLYEADDRRAVRADQVARLRRILLALEGAEGPEGMDLPGLRLHSLKGDRKGAWAVSVSGNWRVTFRFDGRNAADVDLEDYH